MISTKHGVNFIHNFSNLSRANESRNTHFINCAQNLVVLLGFAEHSYLAGGSN
jgi:hypothetical protein